MDIPEHPLSFSGPMQGVVIGDGNQVTINFQSDQPYHPPFLAPPGPTHDLVGRDPLLQDLKQHLIQAQRPVLRAIHGLPGVGKTTLLLSLVADQEILGHFSDGVLWASLGPHPDIPTLLGRWVETLLPSSAGLAAGSSLEAQMQAIHQAIGQRRMLLIIDDAWQPEEAKAFKLGGPRCAYLLTTRSPELAACFAEQGADVIHLHELNEADSLALLGQLAPQIIQVEPEAARQLAQLVDGLPLALTLMGHYVRTQTHSRQPRRLRMVVTQLKQTKRRLHLQQVQNPLERPAGLQAHTPLSLAASIEISYHALTKRARVLLLALSVFPVKPNTFSEEAALAVSAETIETLDILLDSGLLESVESARYRLHQTIADFAALKRRGDQAYERMVSFFRSFAAQNKAQYPLLAADEANISKALEWVYQQGQHEIVVDFCLHLRNFWSHTWRLVDGLHFLPWGITAAEALAQTGREQICYQQICLAITYGQVQQNAGNVEEAERSFVQSLHQAQVLGDEHLQGAVIASLGQIYQRRGQFPEAQSLFEQALPMLRTREDWRNISTVMLSLGEIAREQGNYQQAKELYEAALEMSRRLGDRRGEGLALISLGELAGLGGRFEEVRSPYQLALECFRELGDQRTVGVILGYLGRAELSAKQFEEADAHFQQALEIARQVHDPQGEGVALGHLGMLAFERGRYGDAQPLFQQALRLATQVSDQRNSGTYTLYLGKIAHATDRLEEAEALCQQALEIARQGQNRRGEAEALYALGRLSESGNTIETGEQHYQQALAILHQLDHKQGEGVVLYQLACCARQRGYGKQAEDLYRQSLAICRETQSNDDIAQSLVELAQFLIEELGKPKEGWAFLVEAQQLAGLPAEPADDMKNGSPGAK